jgi:hypothetical protein
MRKLDFPRLRAFDVCPLCSNAKSRGTLCCWECHNSRGDHDPHAERRFQRAELALESVATTLARTIEHGASYTRPIITTSEVRRPR